MKKPTICFFIGTEAELIKVFTVIRKIKDSGLDYRIVSSGQNDISKSRALFYANGGRIDVQLSDERDITKTAWGLVMWFLSTLRRAKTRIQQALPDVDFARSVMVVHGDTVSTVMGAKLGDSLGMRVAHIEAGLRSHHLLHPFPEEINRQLTSRYARVHFAPDDEAEKNLKKAKGAVVNTHYNTIIDSIAASKDMPCQTDLVEELKSTNYFVLVLHRQENLANRALIEKIIKRITAAVKIVPCVFVMHKPTEVTLKAMGLYDSVADNPNITLIPRTDYFDFTVLLHHSKFVISDGGSNQEELFYMGKPCLIIRTHTERSHGLGKNAVLYNNDDQMVTTFIETYERFNQSPVVPALSPTGIIAEYLKELQKDLTYLGGEQH